MITKKASSRQRGSDVRSEYRFAYTKSRPNRFASRMLNTVAVVLEPDVATAFKTSAYVNRELRRALANRSDSKKAG